MDADAKKTALRMIPYGIYVLTAEGSKGVAAATVNWVTQTSFDPPLVVGGGQGRFRRLSRPQGCRPLCLEHAGQGPARLGLHLLQAGPT